MMFKRNRPQTALALCAILGSLPHALRAAPADGSLVANGDFEAEAGGWPEGWGRIPEASWEKEGANRFLRLSAAQPDKTVLLYRAVNIPAEARALELSWRWRVSDLQKGKQSWFDARIMMNFKDAIGGKQLDPGPPAPNSGSNTEGWATRSIRFLVPPGAKILELMPSLLQVEKGTLDLDDVVLKPVDAAPLQAAAQARDAADKEKQAKVAEARQTKAAEGLLAAGSLIPNGDFQSDADNNGAPEGWGSDGEGIGFEQEGQNRFVRLTSTTPGKMTLIYRTFDLPRDLRALELTWKQRVSGLKTGKQPWFDARIMMKWKDASGQEVQPGPPAPNTQRDTGGWVERSVKYLVPENAVTLEFMPTLFQVEAGTFDLDDFVLKATDPAPLQVEAAARARDAAFARVEPEAPQKNKWPQELHTQGNKIVGKDGKEVWLQGVNIDSLEFLVRGDHVLRSVLVAIGDWKSNFLRLPVKEEYWFGREATQNDGGAAYRELVDAAITLAANRGAYVMLDLHRFRAPQQVHADFWKDAATRYKNHPAVLFDLFNEPHGTSWKVWRDGGFIADKNAPADEDAFLSPEEKALNTKGFHAIGMQALVNTVRATGARNIIAAGGLDWAYDLSGVLQGFALDDKGGGGIIYSTHIYAGKRDWANKVLAIAEKYPIVVGEVGANTKKFDFIPAEAQEDAAVFVPRVLGFIQQHRLHWTGWSFHPGSAPVMITGWDYTPTPEWGALAKRALAGEKFPPQALR